MEEQTELYDGGYERLMRERKERCQPLIGVEDVLPPPDVDLRTLYQRPVVDPLVPISEDDGQLARVKWLKLQKEFVGQNELLLLHAMLIAISRRTPPHPQALDLFFRCWTEMAPELIRDLPVRWLISATVTFAECGTTGDQRALGMGLATVFDMIKLSDSERRLSGQPSRIPFTFDKNGQRYRLPYGLLPYSRRLGDLDRTILARLWELSEREPIMRPLAQKLLQDVMTDDRSIFGRLQRIKARLNR